jgi:hypothetical protein
MSQYTVEQECEKTCLNCRNYEANLLEDSFGPYLSEYCKCGHYRQVGRYAEPCKDFKDVSGNDA